MDDARTAPLLASLLVAVAAVAAVLEGATLPAHGGACLVAVALLAAGTTVVHGVDAPNRLVRLGLGLLLLTLIWQVTPLPPGARRLIAPGQAAWVDLAAPEWTGDLQAWLDALARYDVLAAVGVAGPWEWDPLQGSVAHLVRPGTIAPGAWPWAVAQLGGAALCWILGVTVGRSDRGARTFAILLLLAAVAEALFGIANREGTTTGIGTKTAYLGSATGTFINRGHFASFLALGLGAAWGLGAALFPLVPEEVRRHRARQRRSSQPPSVLEVSGDKLPRLVLLGFAAAVLGIALVASQSRGPVLSFALAGAAVGIYAWRRRDEPFHLGIGLGLPVVSAVLAAVGFGLRGAFGRFATLLRAGDVSFTSRVQVWRDGLDAFLDAPLFGAGAGAWRLAWGSHEAGVHLYDFNHAHDELVEQLVELGAVGTVGLGLLVLAWVRQVRAGIDLCEHTPRTAIGIGCTVGVVAVGFQSVADFPLHTPAVLLATATAAGVASGSLSERQAAGTRAPVWGAVALVAVLAGWATTRDHDHPGTRAERLGEVPQIYYDEWALDAAAGRAGFAEEAARVARWAPLDPWGQLALALAEGRLAQAATAGDETAGPPEDRAFAAERALARALRLRPRSPRVQIAGARVLLALAGTGAADARRERAVALLSQAVADDAWRAREAFELASSLPLPLMERVAERLPADAQKRARVRYEYGRALDERGEKGEARAAWAAALQDDPEHGPALFALGVVARGEGDTDTMRDLLNRFLKAKERPGGMEGWAWLYLGDVDAAEVRFRRSVGENPANTWAWEGLAEVALRRGDAEAERQVWRRVLQLRPGDKRATERMKVLGG